MNITRQRILEKSFNLFLEKGYDGVSISDIQEETGLGRASLYHHFRSKEDLFNSVMLHCYLSAGRFQYLKDYKNAGLKEMLGKRVAGLMDYFRGGDENRQGNVSYFNYYILAFQALKSCPDFDIEMIQLDILELEQWKRVITNAVESGEIRRDTDIEEAARLFINAGKGIVLGLAFKSSKGDAVAEADNVYQGLYRLLTR
jgi:AcrR family transcriptional regulator